MGRMGETRAGILPGCGTQANRVTCSPGAPGDIPLARNTAGATLTVVRSGPGGGGLSKVRVLRLRASGSAGRRRWCAFLVRNARVFTVDITSMR